MLTKEQSKQLKKLIKEKDEAAELVSRSMVGHTNFSADEVSAKYKLADKGLKDFIDEITEN